MSNPNSSARFKAIFGRRSVKTKEGRVLEVMRQPLYGRQTLTTAANQSVDFFKGNSSSNLIETNLNGDSKLANPHVYSVYGISVVVEYGAARADIIALMNEAVVEFKLSQKDYLQIPLHKIPAGSGLQGLAELDNQAAPAEIFLAQNGNPIPGSYYPIDVEGIPIFIQPQQDFQLKLTTGPTALSAAVNIWGYLEGVLGKAQIVA